LQSYEIAVFVIIFATFTLIEPLRLWVGQVGNFKEHFERMCGFLILTLIQGGQFAYYIPFQPKTMPIDIIVGVMQAVFFVCEFITTLFALRHFIHVSSLKSTGHFDSSGVMYIDTNEVDNEVQVLEDIEMEQRPRAQANRQQSAK
jgi:hypothetical protein